MIFAQILNGVVQNTIVLDDMKLASLFSQGFDHFVRIDNLELVPSIGWSYDEENFSPPIPPAIEGDGNGN